MAQRVILTISGSDRPGLTNAIADAVLAAGGNWLESHMSRLGGSYVGSVLVELENSGISDLKARIEAIDAGGLHIALAPAGQEPIDKITPLSVELLGQDRPGIIREVSGVLSSMGVNIEDLSTATENSAWSGGQLFRAQARLALADGITEAEVREALEAISGEIMVDFTITAESE